MPSPGVRAAERRGYHRTADRLIVVLSRASGDQAKEVQDMTIKITKVEAIKATRIHLDPKASGA